MRQFAFIFISLLVGLAGAAVLSAQVTAKFQGEHQRLQAAGRANALAKKLTEGELLRNALRNPFADPVGRSQKVLPGGSVAVSVRGQLPGRHDDPVRTRWGHHLRCGPVHDHLLRPPDDPAG